MIRTLAISFFTALGFCVLTAGLAEASDARNPFAPKPAETEADAPTFGALERFYRGLLLKISVVQQDLNRDLHAKLNEIQTSDSILPALIVIGVAFLYGVFHEEELVFVVSGCPDLWVDGELHRLRPGDAAAFPAGTGIAHCLINNTEEDVQFLVVGEKDALDSVIFPVNPERKPHRPWTDAPRRPLGGHDGNATKT